MHKNKNGFTVMELLVSLAIFGVIGTVVVSILFTSLRAGRKADVLVLLKQNGNSAVSQVTKQIRYAKKIESPNDCVIPVSTDSITIVSYFDNNKTTFSCTDGATTTIASNGASLIDLNTASVSNCTFTCSQPTLNDPPTINFTFQLNSKNASSLVETRASVPFQTSITLRNYTQ